MISTPPHAQVWSYQQTMDRPLADLPVLPTTVSRLLALDRESASYFDDLSTAVRADPSLVVRLLAVANSAAYRAGKSVSRIRDAIVRLGGESAAGLVLSRSSARVFVPRKPAELDLWVHSLRVAHLSRALAEACDPAITPAHDAYVCGLLHDLGRFVLMNEASWALQPMAAAAYHRPTDRLSAEKALLGIDHAALGADAGRRWGLPAPITAVIARHHQRTSDADPLSRMVSIVLVADLLDGGDNPRPPTFDAELAATVLRGVLPAWYPASVEETVVRLQEAHAEAEAQIAALLPFRRSPSAAS